MASLKPTMTNLITKALHEFLIVSKKKDKTNEGALMAEWFFWDELETLAKNKGETLRDRLIADGVLKDPKTFPGAGDYELGETTGFISTVKITEKVRAFDPKAAAASLNKSHKVPIPIVLGAIEAAKLPTGTPRKTVKILERA